MRQGGSLSLGKTHRTPGIFFFKFPGEVALRAFAQRHSSVVFSFFVW